MKKEKLFIIGVFLLVCTIGCNRRNHSIDLLTIEELETESEELALYTVTNYTLEDSVFFTREDGSIEEFVVNLVQSARLLENPMQDMNEVTGEIIETGSSVWEYGHTIILENDSLKVLAGISIRQDNT